MNKNRDFAQKDFSNFEDGLKGLAQVSQSAEQALTYYNYKLPVTESEATMALAYNTVNDRPSGNFHGWGDCDIEISPFEVFYQTRGGLVFGWEAIQEGDEYGSFKERYTFYIAHPSGNFPEDSSLKKSAKEHGWEV